MRLAAVPPLTPSCSYTLSFNSNPVAVGQSVSENISCEHLPSGSIVKHIGTKDGIPQLNNALTLVNGRFSSNTLNDGSTTAGMYVRRVEVRSSTDALLYKTPDVSVRLAAMAAPSPTCTYTLSFNSNPVAVGQSVSENISCENLPSGSSVKHIGTKDGVPQLNNTLTLVGGKFSSTTVNDGLNHAGLYVRRVEIRSASDALLFKTPEVSVRLATQDPVSCSYVVTGANPLPVGGVISERIDCRNLPTGAVVRLIGTKDGISQINEPLNLVGNTIVFNHTNDGTPGLAGKYIRFVEVFSSAGLSLFKSSSVSHELLGPKCTHTYSGTNPLAINQTVTEMISCTNIPVGSSIKINSTKDGKPVESQTINLVDGRFAQNFTNTGVPDLVGTWRRSVQVHSSSGVQLLATEGFNYTFSPIDCVYTINPNGYIVKDASATESVICGVLPVGSKLKIVGTKDGSPQIDEEISLQSGRFNRTYVNDGSLAIQGVYERRLEIIGVDLKILKKTPSQTVEFLGAGQIK